MPLHPREKRRPPTGPVTEAEVHQAGSSVWKSASATDAKKKGIRKAALVPLAESWDQLLSSSRSHGSQDGAGDYESDEEWVDDLDDLDEDGDEDETGDGDADMGEEEGDTGGSMESSTTGTNGDKSYSGMSRDQLLHKLLVMVGSSNI